MQTNGNSVPLEIDKFSSTIKRYVLSLTQNYATAEDLTQETMLRAVQHRDEIAAMADPKGWLLRVATNLWRDRLRAAKRRPSRQTLNIDLPDDSENPQAQAESREELAAVLERFQDLPETQRQVLFLRTVEERSIDEIVQILGLSRNNVKVNLSYARKKMRQKFLTAILDENHES